MRVYLRLHAGVTCVFIDINVCLRMFVCAYPPILNKCLHTIQESESFTWGGGTEREIKDCQRGSELRRTRVSCKQVNIWSYRSIITLYNQFSFWLSQNFNQLLTHFLADTYKLSNAYNQMWYVVKKTVNLVYKASASNYQHHHGKSWHKWTKQLDVWLYETVCCSLHSV